MSERSRFGGIRVAALVLALVPTQAIYVPRSLVVPCLVIAAALIFEGWRRRVWGGADRLVVVALGLLSGWAVLSTAWALDLVLALRENAGLAANMIIAFLAVCAAVRLEPAARRTLLWAIVCGMAIAWVFTTMELVFDGVFLRYRSSYSYGLGTVMKPGNAVAVALLAPTVAALLALGRPRLALLMGAAWLAVIPFSYSEAARIGAVALAGGVLISRMAPRVGSRLMMAGLAALILATPLLLRMIPPPQEVWDTYPHLKNSAHHRLAIWRFAGERIAEHPVIGWGMNSSKVMPGAEDLHIYHRSRPDGSTETFHETNLPLHPHNVVVQWWLELGGIGAALGALVVWSLVRLGGNAMPDPWRRALAIGCVIGIMGIFVGAYGAWQSWWLSILALAAMVLALASRNTSAS